MSCYSLNHAGSALSVRSLSGNSPKQKLQQAASIVITTTAADDESPVKVIETTSPECNNHQHNTNFILRNPGGMDGINVVGKRGSWRPFRKDKITPVVCRPLSSPENTSYILPHNENSTTLFSDSLSIRSLESPLLDYVNKPDELKNAKVSRTVMFSPKVSPLYNKDSSNASQNSIPKFKESLQTIHLSVHQTKEPLQQHISSLKPDMLVSATETSCRPFSVVQTQGTSTLSSLFSVPDAIPTPRASSELESADIRCLSVKRDCSWDREDEYRTNSRKQIGGSIQYGSQLYNGSCGSEFTVISKRAGSKKAQISPSLNFRNIAGRSPLNGEVSADRRKNSSFDNEGPLRSCGITNLSTPQGRRWHAAMILGLSVAPIIALLIQNCVELYDQNSVYSKQESIKSDILYSVEIGFVMHMTQIERGTTVLYISSEGLDQTINENLDRAYQNTDDAIASLSKWTSQQDPLHFRAKEWYASRIKQFRDSLTVNGKPNKTEEEAIKFYSDDNDIIQQWIGKGVQLSSNGGLWRTLISYYMLILSKEQAGVERALGGSFFAKGGFTNERMIEYLQRRVSGEAFLDQCKQFTVELESFLEEKISSELTNHLDEFRSEIFKNEKKSPDSVKARAWFSNMTLVIEVFKVSVSTHLVIYLSTY